MVEAIKIFKYIVKYESLLGAIVGAFLASLFGIITQMIVNKSEIQNERKKINSLVQNEMYLNYELAKNMAITKEAIYEFQTDYYDKFIDKIMLIRDEKIIDSILHIYTGLKLYNSGINSNYGLILQEIRELNINADWNLNICTQEELDYLISDYDMRKTNGEIYQVELSNYKDKSKRGYYGIICSIDKLINTLNK